MHDYYTDGIMVGKVAFHVDNTDGEKARFVSEGTMCALVHEDGTMGVDGMEEPEVAVPDGVA